MLTAESKQTYLELKTASIQPQDTRRDAVCTLETGMIALGAVGFVVSSCSYTHRNSSKLILTGEDLPQTEGCFELVARLQP